MGANCNKSDLMFAENKIKNRNCKELLLEKPRKKSSMSNISGGNMGGIESLVPPKRAPLEIARQNVSNLSHAHNFTLLVVFWASHSVSKALSEKSFLSPSRSVVHFGPPPPRLGPWATGQCPALHLSRHSCTFADRWSIVQFNTIRFSHRQLSFWRAIERF